MKFFRKNWHLIISGLLGILMFFTIFGIEPLRDTGIGWTQYGYGGHDITQHQTGWMFYRNAPWAFPLCKALFLGYPQGTSISYTDSIPLFAVIFIGVLLNDYFIHGLICADFCWLAVMGAIALRSLLYTFFDAPVKADEAEE